MRNLNIYIWGNEQHNIYHLIDYAKNDNDNTVSLFFLRKPPAELANRKNVYTFDFSDRITPAWIDGIYNISRKINATSVRIHSAIEYSANINYPLVKKIHQDVPCGMQLSLFLYEASFNDIAYRQQLNNLLGKGLRYLDFAEKLKQKTVDDNSNWHAIYNYLFNYIVDTHYFFNRLYLNADKSLFSASHYHYADHLNAYADEILLAQLTSLSGVKNNTIALIKKICEQKKTLFFIDDGADFPLGEEDKDTVLLQGVLEQGFEFVFLINYTGSIDSKSYPTVNFIRLPDAITPELLTIAGVSPDVIYGLCSLSIFSCDSEKVKKVYFHEHKKNSENIRLSHFLRSHYSKSIPFLFIDETQKRLEKNYTEKHIFYIGESMGDALFAIGSMNALRRELSGAFILLAPKIYHELLVLCPYVDTVWDRDNLDKTMKEDIYISTILGKYHQPCSGAHIFASQHQIDSILDCYNKKNISNARKEIVLSLDDIDKKKVDGFIESNNLTSKVVLIHPNEGVPNRTWPKASWEALIELFLNDGWSVVLIGANNNFYTHKKTVEIGSSRVFNAIDKFTMGETVYLMSRSSLLVACDSGPVALAAATDIAICGLYSVVPGKYRLPYRHGILGWNALAINLSCQYVHCAKYYPLDTRGTFDAWCPNNNTYSCIEKYKVNDFYREINRFLDSKKFIDQLPDYI